jgi:hypothetical protein
MLLLATARAGSVWNAAIGHYEKGDYVQASAEFGMLASNSPSAAVFQNLGLAEWGCTNTGLAILTWERELWLEPRATAARNNLLYARRSALIGEPELAWYEICSAWLSAGTWAIIACVSFWATLCLMILPGLFGYRKTTVATAAQMLAAGGFAIFLVTLPAMYGINSRMQVAIVLERETPLLLTPTVQGEIITRISSGETARVLRERGKFCYVRTSGVTGWIQKARLGFIAAE